MIDYDTAINRAQWLQDHGQFTTVPLYKLAERLQDLERMCDHWKQVQEHQHDPVITNLGPLAANANT